MDNTGYVALARQSGLMLELGVVANNIANLSTIGFRREGLVFSEHVRRLEGGPPLSMAHANARIADLRQGGLTRTGGTFDLAIEGDGFFLVESGGTQYLTRAGNFLPLATGELATPDGAILLGEGAAPVTVPPGAAAILVGQDGTVSADGEPVGRIAIWSPNDPASLRHEGNALFFADNPVPVEDATLLQGHLEESNVQPVREIARMIAVQRAYDMGQALLDREDQRLKLAIDTLGR